MNVDLILEGEFAFEPSQAAKAERAKYIVHRMATVTSTAAMNQEIAKCPNKAGVWQWNDNRITVVDIRPR